MNKLLTIVCFLPLLAFAAQPHSLGIWNIYSFGNAYAYKPMSADAGPGLAQFSFPVIEKKIQFAAILSTTTDPLLLGDLTGKTITLTAHVMEVGNPIYWYGGLRTGWNTCPVPANFRFWLSPLSSNYVVDDGVDNPSHYWLSNPAKVFVDDLNGTFSIVIEPSQWMDAMGNHADNPVRIAGFLAAVANVKQIGIFFSGGCYSDLGIGLQPNTGASTFTLDSFTVQ